MSEFFAKFKGYRTLIVNAAVLVSALLTAVGLAPIDGEALANHVEAIVGGVVAAVAVVNMWLRLFTTTVVGKKQ